MKASRFRVPAIPRSLAEADGLREECGVIGIVSGDGPAAPMAHLGLYSLQHRGQESAGIATSDGAGLWYHRGMGLVFLVFGGGCIAWLPGAGDGGRGCWYMV